VFEIINKEQIDILFLDINLPGISGIDFIKSLKTPPAVIFTTAYSEFAVNSYELEAIDYLLKPITPARFRQSIHKILKIRYTTETEKVTQYIFIKVNSKLVKILQKDILYIEARKDYLMIHTMDRYYMTHMTMKAMEEILPNEKFQRVHRSYIIGLNSISCFSSNQIEIGDKKIPVGEKYKKEIVKKFNSVNQKK
jgi:two-component system LytT family response regulator